MAPTFDQHGVCWSRCQTVAELVLDPACSMVNPMFQSISQPDVGTLLAADIPLDFDASARQSVRPTPQLGAHTEEVLAELLCMDAAQFGRRHDQGVVRSAGD